MTPTTSAVRAACDTTFGNKPPHGCNWPKCGCPMADKKAKGFLAVLLANARAEGAAGEREAGAEAMRKACRAALVQGRPELAHLLRSEVARSAVRSAIGAALLAIDTIQVTALGENK